MCAAVRERFSQARDYLDAYDRFGLVGARSVFAHGIHLSTHECSRLAETGAGVAVCPSSNLFLGSGMFDFAQAAAHGVRLGLGSDIGAGTTFSLLHTAGLAYQVGQAHGYRLDPFRALWLATAGVRACCTSPTGWARWVRGRRRISWFSIPRQRPCWRGARRGPICPTRCSPCKSWGMNRTVSRTYVMGQCAWDRDRARFATMDDA